MSVEDDGSNEVVLDYSFCEEHARQAQRFDAEICLTSARIFTEGVNSCPTRTMKFSPSVFRIYHTADFKSVTRFLAVTELPSNSEPVKLRILDVRAEIEGRRI